MEILDQISIAEFEAADREIVTVKGVSVVKLTYPDGTVKYVKQHIEKIVNGIYYCFPD